MSDRPILVASKCSPEHLIDLHLHSRCKSCCSPHCGWPCWSKWHVTAPWTRVLHCRNTGSSYHQQTSDAESAEYCQVKLQISRPKNVSSSRNRKSSPQYVMDTVLLLFTSYNLLAKVCEVIEYQRSVTYGRIIVFWILLLCEAVECLLVLRWCSWWWCLLRCRPWLCLGCCCACCCRRCDLLF